jgi:hypothetical protein
MSGGTTTIVHETALEKICSTTLITTCLTWEQMKPMEGYVF